MYWITASMFSTGQILLLKIAWMRRALGIPDRVKHERKPEDELKKGGFFAALKESKCEHPVLLKVVTICSLQTIAVLR